MWETVPYCDIKEGEIDAYLLKPNDILFARTGGTVGKSYLVQEVPEEAIYAGYLIRTKYSNQLCPQYLKYFMESELYWSQLREGTIVTAQPNCNGKTLGNMLVPIPPSHEQIRIVKKLNAVMAHVIEYGTIDSRLKHLNNIFPERLKKSILQEAVQGKLVPQDPYDEPAAVLLERIRAEKQKLVAEGKIKRDKHESVIFRMDNSHYEKHGSEEVCIDDKLPFEIPKIRPRSIHPAGKLQDKYLFIWKVQIKMQNRAIHSAMVRFLPRTADQATILRTNRLQKNILIQIFHTKKGKVVAINFGKNGYMVTMIAGKEPTIVKDGNCLPSSEKYADKRKTTLQNHMLREFCSIVFFYFSTFHSLVSKM